MSPTLAPQRSHHEGDWGTENRGWKTTRRQSCKHQGLELSTSELVFPTSILSLQWMSQHLVRRGLDSSPHLPDPRSLGLCVGS